MTYKLTLLVSMPYLGSLRILDIFDEASYRCLSRIPLDHVDISSILASSKTPTVLETDIFEFFDIYDMATKCFDGDDIDIIFVYADRAKMATLLKAHGNYTEEGVEKLLANLENLKQEVMRYSRLNICRDAVTVAEARVLVRSRLEAGNLPCIFVDADFEVGTDADAVYDLSKFAAYAADLSPEKMDRLKDELFGRIIDDIEYRLKTFPAHLSYLKIYIRLREPSDDTFEFIKEIVTSLKEQYKVVFSYWTEIIN